MFVHQYLSRVDGELSKTLQPVTDAPAAESDCLPAVTKRGTHRDLAPHWVYITKNNVRALSSL